MSKTITFEDAKQEGIILPEHYIVVTMPYNRKVTMTERETGWAENQPFSVEAGENKLFRIEEGFKLWGPPTREGLRLRGETGFEQGPDTMDELVRELYDVPSAFEKARACSLPQKDYFFHSSIQKAFEEGTKYAQKDKLSHWLASRCVSVDSNYAFFRVFRVYSGYVYPYNLYSSNGGADGTTNAVRPEIIPKSTLLLETEGCDGSKENPWKCVGK